MEKIHTNQLFAYLIKDKTQIILIAFINHIYLKPPINEYQEIIDTNKSGNEAFREKDEDQAIIHYLEAILSIEDEKEKTNLTDKQKEELRRMEIESRNNLAQVKDYIKDYHSVIIQSEAVLKLDQNNLRAKFMLAKGLHEMGRFEKALNTINELIKQDFNNADYQELKQKCEQSIEKLQKEGKKEENYSNYQKQQQFNLLDKIQFQ